MRIVIAPDKFKGSLSAPDVCQAPRKGPAGGRWREPGRPPDSRGRRRRGHPRRRRRLRLHPPERHGQRPHRPADPGRLRRPRPRGRHRNGGGLRAWPCSRRYTVAGSPTRQRRHGHQPWHRPADPRGAGRRLPADHPGRRRQRQHRRRRRRSCRDSAPGSSTPTATNCPPGGAALANLHRIDFSGFERPAGRRHALCWPVRRRQPAAGRRRRRGDLRPAEGCLPGRTWRIARRRPGQLRRSPGRRDRTPRRRPADAPGAGAAGGVGYAAIAVLAATRGRASTSCLNSPDWPTGWPAQTW